MPDTKSSRTNELLSERGARYGDFADLSNVAQALKGALAGRVVNRGISVRSDQAEAIEMICTKLARIVNGDLDYIDNWDDIAGYANLVADRLRRDQCPETSSG